MSLPIAIGIDPGTTTGFALVNGICAKKGVGWEHSCEVCGHGQFRGDGKGGLVLTKTYGAVKKWLGDVIDDGRIGEYGVGLEVKGKGGTELIDEVAVAEVCALLANSLSCDLVAIEDFVLRGGAPGGGVATSSVRSGISPARIAVGIMTYLHVLEFECKFGIGLQQPSAAKGVMSDVRMKKNGYWVPGAPHATDAYRHALLGLRSVL